jgi:hypothetical protein
MADTSMYSNSGRGVQEIEQPDLGAAMQQGMNLRALSRQNRMAEREESESMAMSEAMKRNVGPDGKLNRKGALSELAKINPMKAMQAKDSFRKDDLAGIDAQEKKIEHALNQNAVIGQFLESAKDQNSWSQGLERLTQMGIDVSRQPREYSEGYARQSYFKSMDYGKRLEGARLQFAQQKQAQDYGTDQRKLDIEEGKIAADRNPSAGARLAKMGGEVKQKVGFITGGMQALTRYEEAVRAGGKQGYVDPSTPLIGQAITSTPIDEARTSVEEAIGRLASGGAINKDEESRFRRMMPTAADYRDPKVVARKLMNLRQEMEGKLTAYGFNTSELADIGYKPDQLGYDSKYSQMEDRGLTGGKQSGGLIQSAQAAEAPRAPKPAAERTPQDAEALHWAKNNPGDPRAQQILQLHGEK